MATASPRRGNPTHYEGDLRQTLIQAATDLIGARGTGVSLRAVAREVGVSHAAPAHHFGDHHGLLTAVAAAGFDHLADRLEASVANAPKRPLGPLAAAGRTYARFGAENRAIFELMFQGDILRTDDPELRRSSDRALAVLRNAVTLARAGGRAFGPDEDHMTMTCWALAHGLAGLTASSALPGGLPAAERLVEAALVSLATPSGGDT